MFLFRYICDIENEESMLVKFGQCFYHHLCLFIVFLNKNKTKQNNSYIYFFYFLIFFFLHFQKDASEHILIIISKVFEVVSGIGSGTLFQTKPNIFSLLGILCLLFMLVFCSISNRCFIMVFTCLKSGYQNSHMIMVFASSVSITLCSISFSQLLLWLSGQTHHPSILSVHTRSSVL